MGAVETEPEIEEGEEGEVREAMVVRDISGVSLVPGLSGILGSGFSISLGANSGIVAGPSTLITVDTTRVFDPLISRTKRETIRLSTLMNSMTHSLSGVNEGIMFGGKNN